MISATKVRKQGKESGMRWLANTRTQRHTDVCTTHAHMMFAVAIVNE